MLASKSEEDFPAPPTTEADMEVEVIAVSNINFFLNLK